tara:strand:+ start:463 stop:603 length:141 start_codon:yes stop_codon:yes gene_type:complete
MKKLILAGLFVLMTAATFSSCREKSPSEKIEDGVEEVGEGIEDAVD